MTDQGEISVPQAVVEPNPTLPQGSAIAEQQPSEPILETPLVSENREITPQTRKQEAGVITHAVLSRISHEASKSDEKTDAQKVIETYQFLSNHLKNPTSIIQEKIPTTNGNPLQLSFEGSKGYVAVETGGMQILSLNGKVVEGDVVYFVCNVEGLSKEVNVPVSEVIRAQLFTEGKTILDSISDPQQKEVIQTYFDSLKNPDTELNIDDETIQTTAKKTGLFTQDIASNFIAQIAEGNPALQQKLNALIEGKNILAPEDVVNLISYTSDITDQIGDIQDKIDKYKTSIHLKEVQLQTASNKDEVRAEIDNLKKEMESLTAEQTVLNELKTKLDSTPMLQILQQYYDGKGDLTQAHSLQKAMNKADMMQMYTKMVGEISDPKRKEFFEKAGKLAAQAGGLGLALIIILMMESLKGD